MIVSDQHPGTSERDVSYGATRSLTCRPGPRRRGGKQLLAIWD